MQDRNKDPHDFFAYPVYFFRSAEKKKTETGSGLRKRRKVIKNEGNSSS